MNEAEAFAQAKALSEQRFEVTTIREKWIASGKVLCVAPKEIRTPLAFLAINVQQSQTLEEAREYGAKIAAILEWVWPHNTPQHFHVIEHEGRPVEIPVPRDRCSCPK